MMRLSGRLAGSQKCLSTGTAKALLKDFDSIKPGDDLVEVITNAVGSCGVLLALIGYQWLNMIGPDGRRQLRNVRQSPLKNRPALLRVQIDEGRPGARQSRSLCVITSRAGPGPA